MGGTSILKVLFALTYLSPLGESVVSAASFNKVKDKAQFLHGGCPELVRIQLRLSRKRYLKSKHTYEYERMYLHIPKKHHEAIKPFLNQDLKIHVKTENDSIVITLSPEKTFRPAANAPPKTPQERVQDDQL
jgi:hypothetical protein